MCEEFSARLFRPWSNLDTRDHSKQIEVPVGHDDGRDIVVAENSGGSGPSEEQLTSKVVHPLNDNSLRTADCIKMPLVQDIVDPVFHPMYSWNSFRKFNLPHSTPFDAVMVGARLPTQMGIAYPPWIDIRKTQFLSAFQPSYDVRGNLHAETMDRAVQILQRQAKEPKKLRSKRFRCERCNVAFSNNGQLKGHIRIHTGERPFKCDVENCGKAFTRNEELTRHKRIHTGLRPHACLVCGKSFGRKDHLKKHMRTHENRDYRLSAATLGMFTPGHILSSQGLLFPHYNFPT